VAKEAADRRLGRVHVGVEQLRDADTELRGDQLARDLGRGHDEPHGHAHAQADARLGDDREGDHERLVREVHLVAERRDGGEQSEDRHQRGPHAHRRDRPGRGRRDHDAGDPGQDAQEDQDAAFEERIEQVHRAMSEMLESVREV
jgi:hypothetical protein